MFLIFQVFTNPAPGCITVLSGMVTSDTNSAALQGAGGVGVIVGEAEGRSVTVGAVVGEGRGVEVF